MSAPASKSLAHRLLLCTALGAGGTAVRCGRLSDDVAATAACLRALGAKIAEEDGVLRVTPIGKPPEHAAVLPCCESGSTLRFLLPVAGALGARATFRRAGRLPERPLAPLVTVLRSHGMTIWEDSSCLYCEGKLLAGEYAIDGGVSSQFVTGLLYALPLLEGDSALSVTGAAVSAPYIAMTERVLRASGIRFEKAGRSYRIPGGQRFAPPPELCPDGDWSGAAAFLCMGALSRAGVTVRGLRPDSPQGDRVLPGILRRFGAQVEISGEMVTARRGVLRGCTLDAGDTPDLVPVLAALASIADGVTRVTGAARLRDKESDRLRATAAMLNALGADVTETTDGLLIRGKPLLRGGEADTAGDHRIAMAAAVAACACGADVTLRGASCVSKSYPAFWEDFSCLSM